MHILLFILGALAAVGTIIWRIQMAAQAAKELGEVAKTAANLPRKLAFRHRSGKQGAKLVTDPREAAVILMLEVARSSGDVSREQKNVICQNLTEHFGFSADEAEDILVQASWVSQEEAGTEGLIRRMTKLIVSHVTPHEVQQLEQMLISVSEAEGQPNADHIYVIQKFRAAAGL